jgi:hypothetical protein
MIKLCDELERLGPYTREADLGFQRTMEGCEYIKRDDIGGALTNGSHILSGMHFQWKASTSNFSLFFTYCLSPSVSPEVPISLWPFGFTDV